MWQLCAAMMSWIGRWVESIDKVLPDKWMLRELEYQTFWEGFSYFLQVRKESLNLFVNNKLNSSLRHIIVTLKVQRRNRLLFMSFYNQFPRECSVVCKYEFWCSFEKNFLASFMFWSDFIPSKIANKLVRKFQKVPKKCFRQVADVLFSQVQVYLEVEML